VVERSPQLARRMQRLGDLLACAQILWIDDHQEGNAPLRRVLRRRCAVVDLARSSAEAERRLLGRDYDLVVSDIGRDDPDDEPGNVFLERLEDSRPDLDFDLPPFVFYVGFAERPAPRHAFEITDRPDELLNLVLDVLERLDEGRRLPGAARHPPRRS